MAVGARYRHGPSHITQSGLSGKKENPLACLMLENKCLQSGSQSQRYRVRAAQERLAPNSTQARSMSRGHRAVLNRAGRGPCKARLETEESSRRR